MSKRYSFSDTPRNVSRETYDAALGRFVEFVSKNTGLISVYGLGGIGHPGISDIDVLLVFADGAQCRTDFRKQLSDADRYLFVHAPYATSRSLLLEAQQFTFFRPYRHLYGEEVLFGKNFPEASPLVRHQVAFEYLLRMYFSLHLQRAYRLLRVRSTLLNAKGAFIDILHLEPADLTALRMSDRLNQLRGAWFSGKQPPLKEFVDWFDEFIDWFGYFLQEQFSHEQMYLPEDRTYSIAKNLSFSKGVALTMESRVRRLPLLKPLMGRKYFNVLNRFSQFHALVPFSSVGIPELLSAYFGYNDRHRAYNGLHLPATLPLTNSLHLR